ncbi:acetyl-CoA carboxylase biotin carboxylase subunit [Bradyrhizobium canariense]|uniref:biotin carboxylase n=1 Tax=Bradyrhizobium canariense TaxID=255045 RepID=A0A1H1XPS6_9BRAD|nr:acetyl-CoA carboxylase biotin carboxylase subunit [Bradyrhizobium canariense]SDT11234.1 acetyl-CoA carboxylase, biotin carboxylase subunit [Bradyrhizobium canariense]
MKRVLIANRGEIAVRIARSALASGLEVVSIFSEADRGMLHTRMSHKAICIGPSASAKSYLNASAIITAAIAQGCDAIHPGYGFLSENAAFASACEENGITFIGPAAETIVAMGDKVNARKAAASLGIATVPGTIEPLADVRDATFEAKAIGFPLLLKAAAGGGGRGMRVVREERELAEAFSRASAEALSAFGDGRMYMERYLEDIRHIEVQILADAHGNVRALGERDCTIQRRHQKLLEEAPSYELDSAIRREISDAAVALARAINYRNAGTIEFVFDRPSRRFYFIEMNTRIQVEHPVTEMIMGVDIVEEQLRIASGMPIDGMPNTTAKGHAIEFRINAEDADAGFRPNPGRIKNWLLPMGEGLRIDTHCEAGTFVPPYYDSLIAKLVVHAGTRNEAIERSKAALAVFKVEGVSTTIPFHQSILLNNDYVANDVNTRWVEEVFLART